MAFVAAVADESGLTLAQGRVLELGQGLEQLGDPGRVVEGSSGIEFGDNSRPEPCSRQEMAHSFVAEPVAVVVAAVEPAAAVSYSWTARSACW